MKELYENSYRSSNHFSFGKNWQDFLKNVSGQKVKEAEESLVKFLSGKENIAGKDFVDIGCGSGLFSLAACRLEAKKIVSIDIDELSVECAKYLHRKESNPERWTIKTGSALNQNFLNSLGTFDIVYSWGVLHHTGDMYQALKNITSLIHNNGKLYIAIYNDNQKIMEGTSDFWLKIKRLYNKSNWFGKKVIEIIYTAYYLLGLSINLVNPVTYIKNYTSLRGMSFATDIKDWLGGYPYEYASLEKITNFFNKIGFTRVKYTRARSIGCNEFLFTRNNP